MAVSMTDGIFTCQGHQGHQGHRVGKVEALEPWQLTWQCDDPCCDPTTGPRCHRSRKPCRSCRSEPERGRRLLVHLLAQKM